MGRPSRKKTSSLDTGWIFDIQLELFNWLWSWSHKFTEKFMTGNMHLGVINVKAFQKVHGKIELKCKFIYSLKNV